MKITETVSSYTESPQGWGIGLTARQTKQRKFKAFPERQGLCLMATPRRLRANMNGLKDLPSYFSLSGDKCITSLRVHPHLHPVLKAPMFGTKAIEEFLILFQLEVLAITAYIQLNLFRHLSPLL
jgi:hypothetical protein